MTVKFDESPKVVEIVKILRNKEQEYQRSPEAIGMRQY